MGPSAPHGGLCDPHYHIVGRSPTSNWKVRVTKTGQRSPGPAGALFYLRFWECERKLWRIAVGESFGVKSFSRNEWADLIPGSKKGDYGPNLVRVPVWLDPLFQSVTQIFVPARANPSGLKNVLPLLEPFHWVSRLPLLEYSSTRLFPESAR